jgi:broad specificity phosphatase PhoE
MNGPRLSHRPEVVLLVVRHGRTPWAAQGRFTGQADIPLSAAGLADATLAAQRVADRLDHLRAGDPPYLLSSDLRRAVATARMIATRLRRDVRTHPGLREEHLGPWEGLTHQAVQSRFPVDYGSWQRGRSDAFAGREGLDRVAARAAAVVHRALSDPPVTLGAPIIVVTHANTALALVGHLTRSDRRAWAFLPTPGHGGMIVCRRPAGGSSWDLVDVVRAPNG